MHFIFRTLRTLTRRYFLSMLLLSLAATGIGYLLFFYGIAALLGATSFVSLHWLDWMLDALTGVGVGILSWFLFPAILPLIASMFLEQIAGSIEKREYGLTPPHGLPFWQGVGQGASFAALALTVNLLLLPFYLFPLLFPLLYYPVNAWLLGREFYETIAARHVGRKEAREMRRQQRFSVLFAGGLLVLMTNLPIANLFAPFLGVAMMVHIFRSTRNPEPKPDLHP